MHSRSLLSRIGVVPTRQIEGRGRLEEGCLGLPDALSGALGSTNGTCRSPPKGSGKLVPRENGRKVSKIIFFDIFWQFFCPARNPEDPAILKILRRDRELLRSSVFTTPPIFTTLWTPLWGEEWLQNPGRWCQAGGVAIANHCAIVNLLRVANLLRRSIFTTAGSFGKWSKSVESIFDTFWRFLTFFDVAPFPPAPFAVRWT